MRSLYFLTTSFLLLFTFSTFAQKPACYDQWKGTEIGAEDAFTVYVVFTKSLYDPNGSNFHTYFSQIFEVSGVLSDGTFVDGSYALRKNNFSNHCAEFRKAVIEKTGMGPSSPYKSAYIPDRLMHTDIECLKEMIAYNKKKATESRNPDGLNTTPDFDFEYEFTLTETDFYFDKLIIREKK